MNKTAYSKHRLALEALFLMGEAILFLPGNESGKYYFFGFLTAMAAAIIGIAVVIPTLNYLFVDSNDKNKFIRWMRIPVSAAAALGGFACAGLCFKRFVGFVSAVFLTSVNKFWIVLIFAALIGWLIEKNTQVILKLSLLLYVLALLIIVLFFVLSVKDFKIANVAIYAFPDLFAITRESKPFLLAISCPALLLPFWEIALFGKAEPGVCLKGFFAGILPIALCLTDCLLLFGAPLAARLSYPLFSAVGTVTVGPLFTRVDGVIYYLLFSSALMKTTLSLKGSVWILRGWYGNKIKGENSAL